ncbi:hypothetical protein Pla175_04310 [Pirellulimonas nuda]|uniref:Uncharacterized protein n=1 Tax=Pirellulimonas nuda TaxID=2528009 RepID=A0A518D6J7_9BACT|nr:hypothetical protein [Pirellulimonas nuda]QDU87076.1 hypothetical protein Pla175_04310 [Pirellulimonas nuda]
MQKHAMALGYFSLAVFCAFGSGQDSLLRMHFLAAGLLAGLAGIGFLVSACAPQLHAVQVWLVGMVRLARQPPLDASASADERAV